MSNDTMKKEECEKVAESTLTITDIERIKRESDSESRKPGLCPDPFSPEGREGGKHR